MLISDIHPWSRTCSPPSISSPQTEGIEYDADDDHVETEFVVEALQASSTNQKRAFSFVHSSADYSGQILLCHCLFRAYVLHSSVC